MDHDEAARKEQVYHDYVEGLPERHQGRAERPINDLPRYVDRMPPRTGPRDKDGKPWIRSRGQSRRGAIMETLLNVGTGFIVSWAVWTFIVTPLYGIPYELFAGLEITAIFTVSSMIRTYVWRRLFNKGDE